jgi:eukaryotic-like serine/threonine-protein kinase
MPAYDHHNVAITRSRLAELAPRPGSGVSPADARAEADRAMTSLQQAVSGGFGALRNARGDPSLDPLRSRPDFQLLLMDLLFPKDPFARGR